MNEYSYTSTYTSREKPFNFSKNYILTEEEEIKIIYFINQLLNEFKIQLELISLETTCFSIMPLGRKICEVMLELLIKNEGYSFTKSTSFMQYVHFSFENDILPKKYYKSLSFIRMQANKAIHGYEPKYGKYMTFFKEFQDFINWFNQSLSNNDEKKIFVEEINLKIKSLLENSNYTNMQKIEVHSNSSKCVPNKINESLEIYQINELLNDYTKQLKSISCAKKFYYVFLGSTITELMLRFLLKKEKNYYPNKRYNFYKYIKILYNQGIIPEACENFLHLIREYRDSFIHGEPPYKLVLSFLNAFNYFIQWFNSYYCQNYDNSFQIEECCKLINSLDYDKTSNTLIYVKIKENNEIIDKKLIFNESETNNDIINIKEEIKTLENKSYEKYKFNQSKTNIIHTSNELIMKLSEELEAKEEIHQRQIKELNDKNDTLLEKFNESVMQLERCMDVLGEIYNQGLRMESKIDILNSKIDKISNQITTIQSFTGRQLKNAQSVEEIERIISAYADECIENIIKYSTNFSKSDEYKIEKQKLFYSIGKDGWNKLCEKSKTFLITSKVMYNHLITMNNIIDFSGICVLVTKALEVEIQKRFFTNFLKYLHEKYGNNYEIYPTALLYKKIEPLYADKITMGNIAFILCLKENRLDSEDEIKNNKEKLIEYCKNSLFSTKDSDEIEELLNYYANSIEEIRIKYRNPSAHTNEIKRVDAEECFNLVLDIEKLLKKMLDSFNY